MIRHDMTELLLMSQLRTTTMMKMQPRFSFSVDSLLGRKTNEADIKSECLGGFTQITDTKSDHRPSGSFVIKYFLLK